MHADNADYTTYNRDGVVSSNDKFEKLVILPGPWQKDPAIIAWADARFAIDIMAEHALFFVLLMPPEIAPKEREEAKAFYDVFAQLYAEIDKNPKPTNSDLMTFGTNIANKIKPFIDYKLRMKYAQECGKLKSLVWPLFFDHTEREASRWCARLMQISSGEAEFDKAEVTSFWTEIMDDHAQFMAHLLDPTEKALIDKAFRSSEKFCELKKEPSSTYDILVAAEDILDFKTKAVRGIETGAIKSIIDPRLADHVRREAVKFIDELKRAV